jgi:hypothetical protein
MADDSVPVAAPAAAVPGAPFLIKTFSFKDVTGNVVDCQAVILCDEYGRSIQPMSEVTGREIVNLLRALVAAVPDSDVPKDV